MAFCGEQTTYTVKYCETTDQEPSRCNKKVIHTAELGRERAISHALAPALQGPSTSRLRLQTSKPSLTRPKTAKVKCVHTYTKNRTENVKCYTFKLDGSNQIVFCAE